jgi:hypothetical protein
VYECGRRRDARCLPQAGAGSGVRDDVDAFRARAGTGAGGGVGAVEILIYEGRLRADGVLAWRQTLDDHPVSCGAGREQLRANWQAGGAVNGRSASLSVISTVWFLPASIGSRRAL